jgi:hypothetical protein
MIGCGLLGAFTAAPAAAITIGQVDDFQDGTLQGWGGGSTPTNIANGGPAGSGDRYLQISAVANNLGTNQTAQWTGNYIAAGVSTLSFQLNNLGANPLALRITLLGPGGAFTTTNETVLAATSGWVSVEFGLGEADLTRTQGIGTLAQTLAGVTTFLFRHDPDPISAPMQGNPVTGTLGIDSVTAVPEPGSAFLLATGLAALALQRKRRSF